MTDLMQAALSILNMIIFIGSLYLIFDRKRVQKLPENPADRLETSARIAVHAIEQLYTHNPSKRDLAIARVVDLYKEWDLPVPSKASIGLAIEAAVLLLPKTDGPQKPGE